MESKQWMGISDVGF